MRIQHSVLRNDHLEEMLDPSGQGFPFVTMKVEIDHYTGKCSPWHWHRMFEIAYVDQGELDYDIPEETITIRKGDILFLNSSVLHTVKAHNDEEGSILYCILYDSHFLSGLYNSMLEEKYFRPLRTNTDLKYLYIPGSHPLNKELKKAVLHILQSDLTEAYGYEFEIQKWLAHFSCYLFPQLIGELPEIQEHHNVDDDRLKQMILFMHKYFSKKILLDDIAHAANISRRECSRCFRRLMNTSPMEYLNILRIDEAAELLSSTSKTVTQISEECGFSSCSYFTTVFRGVMGLTPKEYRKSVIPVILPAAVPVPPSPAHNS